MNKIMQFEGQKLVSVLEKVDYNEVRKLLPEYTNFREVGIYNQQDFDMAVQAGAVIYQKEINGVIRFVVHVPTVELFKAAAKHI